MKSSRGQIKMPIGRSARLAFEIDSIRADCCEAARTLMRKRIVDEVELDECARLDDALAQAQRILKFQVRLIMLRRIKRRSRARNR